MSVLYLLIAWLVVSVAMYLDRVYHDFTHSDYLFVLLVSPLFLPVLLVWWGYLLCKRFLRRQKTYGS